MHGCIFETRCTSAGAAADCSAPMWCGEVPRHMGDIAMRMNWCDLLLLVGTLHPDIATKVYPAAEFARTVKKRGGKVAVFNLERNDAVDADFTFVGKCEATLPLALAV
ncbi:hypothetical protein C8R47DRAFT_972412 [Mycena vitilis]|nr:hypothetical protein C8R47DRAFT_972412 [Mycena vitilis]